MKYVRASALLAVAIISPAMVACAGEADVDAPPAAQESTPDSASSTAAATTSPVSDSAGPATATVAEYASLVAPYASGLRADIKDGLDPEQCSWGLGPPDRDSTGRCASSAETIQREARNLADRLAQARNDDALGRPPDQIAKLVKDTIKVATSTDERADAAQRCAREYVPGCDPKALQWKKAMHEMRDQLADWSRYL
jgi:hypothetical protein